MPKIFRDDFSTRMGPSVPEIFRDDFSPKWDHLCSKRRFYLEESTIVERLFSQFHDSIYHQNAINQEPMRSLKLH